MNRRRFLLAGLAASLLLAGVVSSLAAASPDGLEYATRQGCTVDEQGEIDGGHCIAQAERDHALSGGPLADYGWSGLDGPLATGLAGVSGVLLTFGIGWALFRFVPRREPADHPGGDHPGEAGPAGGS